MVRPRKDIIARGVSAVIAEPGGRAHAQLALVMSLQGLKELRSRLVSVVRTHEDLVEVLADDGARRIVVTALQEFYERDAEAAAASITQA